MASWRQCRVLLVFLLVGCCAGRYILTTPKRWMTGGATQVCVEVQEPSAQPGHLTLSANGTLMFYDQPDIDNDRVLLEDVSIPIPAGSVNFCQKIEVPGKSFYSADVWIRGEISGESVNRTVSVDLEEVRTKTFIQTDKYLYKKGQKVHIGILTVFSVNLTVSTQPYTKVWVTTPSGTRIAQWTNVDNTGGLVHLDMTLADEPEQGQYKIQVKGQNGKTHSNTFAVDEYNLPRFEITVNGPETVLASDKSFSIKLCAMYMYGQPVNGNFTLEINNNSPTKCANIYNITGFLTGCKDFTVSAASLRIVDCAVSDVTLVGQVTETGTGVTETSDVKYIQVSKQGVVFKTVYQDNMKKPGLPYTLKVKADKPDGTSAAGVPVEMCKGDNCFSLQVPEDGMLVTNVGDEEFSNIRMKALNTRVMLHESFFSIDVNYYYSPSKSSLLIYTPDRKLQCAKGAWGSEYQLPVFFVSDLPKTSFTVQIIARSTIQYYKKTAEIDLTPGDLPIRPGEQVEALEDPPVGTKRGVVYIPVTLNNTISPVAKVFVWMVRPDGEVVSDAKEVKMERCLLNQVDMVWSETMTQPGQGVEMKLSSAPNSLCSLGMVDKGTILLDPRSTVLTMDTIFGHQQHSSYTLYQPYYETQEYCRYKYGFSDFGSYFTKHYDALGMLEPDLHVLSNLVLETRPCEEVPEGISGNVIYQGHKVAYSGSFGMENMKPMVEDMRTQFPETWIWDLYLLPASGVISRSLSVPDSITEWVGQAVCVSPENGLGMSQLTNITTFTPFFLDLTLPPSIKRGETLGVLVSIFNYLEASLPVTVQVHSSDEYNIIRDPPSQQAEGVVDVCVAGGSKAVVEVKIKPTVIGQVNITVAASVDQTEDNTCGTPAVRITRRDALVKPITVKAEGFPREKTWNKYICAEDLRNGSDSLGRWDVGAPSGIVEGSDRGWVTVVGSLLSVSLENLGHLIRMPYGCGEQNMINFAPNVFILQYLTNTRQDTPEVTAKLIRLMNIGYQRQILYRRSNGSYSAFGNADPYGSTWLTAFVVKSFAQAQHYITIDVEDLGHSLKWLSHTQAVDGCFPSLGQVFNKALKGGIEGRGREALTAYVLISLLEAGQESFSPTVLSAKSCLLSQESPSYHPYILALKAYALALVGVPEAGDALRALMSQAVVTSNSTHWELPTGYRHSNSLKVEIAGYAALAMMTYDASTYKYQTRKVFKWITAQRNGQGGFYSTQDTVVALQALAKYESLQYQGDMNLKVTVKGNAIDHSFAITESNKLITQLSPLATLPTSLSLTMHGKGCAVFQCVVRYNAHEPDSSDAFKLTVKTQTAADRTCKTKWINVCASYLLPDVSSNMAVISVDLVSGYVPLKEDLKEAVEKSAGVVKRYEVDGNKVIFYVEEMSQGENVCVRMRVERLVEVEGAKPGSITLYDYYEPELSISKIYRLPPIDECQYTS
ncbi:pregnancy zone protein-like [Scylla paramamosain]|uniref:pregnancy zone protein-like n=1 Tax=Scylla paramamosain TaxID=85552 RepID=UPI0030829AE3